jgi:hypothetical protein
LKLVPLASATGLLERPDGSGLLSTTNPVPATIQTATRRAAVEAAVERSLMRHSKEAGRVR